MKYIKCPACGGKDTVKIIYSATAYARVVESDGIPVPGYGVEYDIDRPDRLECWDCDWSGPLYDPFNSAPELLKEIAALVSVEEDGDGDD